MNPTCSTNCLAAFDNTRRRALRHIGAFSAGCTPVGMLGMANVAHGASKPQKTQPPQKILVLGDSLSAEYGLARGTGWVALLGQKLSDRPNVSVVNASISGETTSGGLRRLPALLAQHQPTHVIIELGANDALRGLALKATQDNLDQMTQQCQAAKAKVLIVGMMMPPNFGQRYGQTFAAVFSGVATSRKVGLVPFMLKGVADRPDALNWFQPDGLHPLAKAHPTILSNIWPALAGML
jgi:acyl-CoA thioesterase-1